MNRRQFLIGSIGAAFASPLFISSYAFWIEPEWAEIVTKPLAIRNLPTSLKGQFLVQLSDLHVGQSVSDRYLLEVFRRVRQIDPALVVMTGDFITYRDAAQLRQLSALSTRFPKGRLGTVAVLGNHDYGHGWSEPRIAQEVATILQSAGITVLRNESIVIQGLAIHGADDLWAMAFDPVRTLSKWSISNPSIVLCHNPDAVDHPGWGAYQGWVLSGHTHGGQCKPPFMAPPRLPVANARYSSGEFALGDGRMLYVNRGIGNLWKVRFNARPEITAFRLETADADFRTQARRMSVR